MRPLAATQAGCEALRSGRGRPGGRRGSGGVLSSPTFDLALAGLGQLPHIRCGQAGGRDGIRAGAAERISLVRHGHGRSFSGFPVPRNTDFVCGCAVFRSS